MKEINVESDMNEFGLLFQEIIDAGLYEKWHEFISKKYSDNLVKIPLKDLLNVENQYNIQFPSDIKLYYSEIGSPKSDFHFQIDRIKSSDNQIMIEYQYSEELALQIISNYKSLSSILLNQVIDEIKMVDIHGHLNSYQTVLEYLLWEGVNFYDKLSNSFRIPFINEVYSSLNKNSELLTETFLTWVHCGGGEGIILNTNFKGYNGGLTFGCGLKVKFQSEEFEFYSNIHQYNVRHHLAEFIETIKKFVLDAKFFLQTKA